MIWWSPFDEVALAAATPVEDLAVADEGIAAVEVADEVGLAGCRARFGVGDVVAFEEEEALRVGVVDLFAVGAVGLEAGVQLFAVEPLDAGAVALEGVQTLRFAIWDQIPWVPTAVSPGAARA
jgi:hypothetical protein